MSVTVPYFLQQVPLPENRISRIIIIMLNTPTAGYPYFHVSSGMFVKFIPYHPTSNVNGRKIVVTTVRMPMVRFWAISICDWYISRICRIYSLRSDTWSPSRSTRWARSQSLPFPPPQRDGLYWSGKYRPYRQAGSEKTGDGACLCGADDLLIKIFLEALSSSCLPSQSACSPYPCRKIESPSIR